MLECDRPFGMCKPTRSSRLTPLTAPARIRREAGNDPHPFVLYRTDSSQSQRCDRAPPKPQLGQNRDRIGGKLEIIATFPLRYEIKEGGWVEVGVDCSR